MGNSPSRRKFIRTAAQSMLIAPFASSFVACHSSRPITGKQPEQTAGPGSAIRLNDIDVTAYTGPPLGISNVTGSGLTGSATIDPPKATDPVPVPAEPYRLPQ